MAVQLIAESALSACFQTLFQALSPIFNKGLGLLWGVNDELRRLERELSAVQDVLVDAERRSISEKGVRLWITDLRELAYDMEDLIDEMNTESLRLEMEAKNHPSNYDHVSGNIISMMRDKYIEVKFNVVFKRKVEIVLQKLGEIAKRADYLQLRRETGETHLLSSRGSTRSRETGPSVDVSEVYGRREEIDGIVRLLLAADDAGRKKYDVLSIVGIGGIGKTTLAKMIFQDEQVKSHFDLTSWACVSDGFDVVRVTKDLIEYAANDDCQLKALGSVQHRLEDIVRGKKVLLVLDDVWSSEEWDKLKASLSHCKKGSKVLVTTRSRKIAEDMSRGISCAVGNLDDESCWALFQGKAFGEKDANVQGKVVEMGRKIVEKCQGVPLAVEMLGSYLRGAAEEKWECILNHDLWQVVDNQTGIFPALKISYHVLPSNLKRCFEYFSLFPSDFIFDKKELVHMWIAENFVEAKEGRLLEDIGKEYYEDLQNRSLIQMDNKLHDLVHNLACLVSEKFYCRILSETCTGRPIHSRHVSFWGRDHMMEAHFKSALEPEHFRTIMLSLCNASELLCNLSNFRVLRVLRLKNSKVTEVPDSIGDLKLLRYLDLSFNSGITDLPSSICCLRNLQVLQLEECINLVSLPNGIGNLQNLSYLNLSFTAIPSLPNSICNLVKLQSLYLRFCRKLTCLPETIGDLQSLQELNCNMTSISSFPNSLSNIRCLRLLKNVNADGSVMLSPHVGKLTQLRRLEGYSVSNQMGCGIEELNGMNCLKGFLCISNLENVSSAAKAEMADLKNKKDICGLVLKWGDRSSVDIAVAGYIWQLIELYSFSSNSNIVGDVDVDTSSIREGMEAELKVLEALEPHTASLNYLLLINYMGDRLPGWMSPSRLPSLRCLDISGLRNIVGTLDVKHPSLEELKIGPCIHLDEIFVAAPKLRLLEVDTCQELKSIHVPPSLKELKLKCLFRLSTITESNISSSEAEDCGEHVRGYSPRLLEALEIYHCHSLRALSTEGPPPSMMLKRVDIIDCEKLESLFNDAGSLPVTIEYLGIVGCPLLNCNLKGLTSLVRLRVDELMQSLSDGLPDTLKEFILDGSSSSDDTRFISCVAGWLRNFMTLKTLVITNFYGLRTIQIEEFPLTIEFLFIDYCPCLDFIPTLQPLTSLRVICIISCPRLVSLSDCRLPLSLELLLVSNCENLRFLPTGMHNLNSLSEVALDNCPQLEIRPDDCLAPHQELQIRGCPELEQQLRDKGRKDLLVLMGRYTWH